MSENAVNVLFVAGVERSGTTILHNTLSQVDGLLGAGEIQQVFRHGYVQDRECGCGLAFRQCEVWSRVIQRAGIGREAAKDAATYAGLFANRYIPSSRLRGAAYSENRFSSLDDRLTRLYRALRDVADGGTIVDSSKQLLYAMTLERLPALDVRVLHLTRDPRGVQFSILGRKNMGHRHYQRHNAIRVAFVWNTINSSIERWGGSLGDRYMRLTYEDFVSSPGPVLKTVAEFAGIPDSELPLVDANTIRMSPVHIVTGSHHRTETGTVSLRLDDKWRREMPSWWACAIKGMCLPLMRRYGYA